MKKIIALLGLFMFVLSCTSDNAERPIAVGGPIYGGTIKVLFSERINSLFPLAIENVYQQRLTSQIFETLLRFDSEGENIIPSLCESYTVDTDGKTYVFKLRQNVYFQDDACFINGEGRMMTADDVKFTLDFACSGLPQNNVFHLFEKIIQGAEEFQKKTQKSLSKNSVSGIKVIDKHTLSITLTSSFSDFEKILTHASLGVFSKEAYLKYGTEIDKHPIGTGAFKIDTWTKDEIKLARNEKYWRKDGFGNQLPYIDGIAVQYSKNKKAELDAFKAEKVDWILDIPSNEIENTIGTLEEAQAGKNVKHKLYSKKSLSVSFIAMTNHIAPFNKLDVRRAFSYALDRNKLIKKGLNGQGYAITNGFVPAIDGYPADKIKRENFDVAEAQRLLEKAGYPNGEGFPVVEIYTSAAPGSTSLQLIYAIRDELKANLNIDLKVVAANKKKRDKDILNGKAIIWKNAWVADYPDPLSFLEIFSSYSPISSFSFDTKESSDEFSRLLNEARLERDQTKRNELYLKCDQMIVDQLPIILLYNDDFISMVNAKVRNFKTNSMEQLDFSILFISNSKKKNSKLD